ncbi:M23 family metallopeptidase [Streptomyces sp. NPDC051569]|uniref:M23 family metallopeptidase n=1 Tax=Streptomyces sp. NPDC051569 TaxID=3365661 RepID=UPI00378DFC56
MSQRNLSRISLPPVLRTRAGVVAAGVGVTLAVGAGSAFAATGDSGSVSAKVTATATATSVASAVQQQAVAQGKAAVNAHEVAVKAHEAKLQQAKAAAVQAKAQARANAKKAASWIDPVKHYKLSAGFGLGGNMWQHKHSGQDFAVPTGTAVHATHGGTVVKAGSNGAGDGPAYGNAIVIKHKSGTYSQYAHLSKIKVHIGERVNTGELIGLSGDTGNSTGPHLHFEIRKTANYGSAINPVPFLRALGTKV